MDLELFPWLLIIAEFKKKSLIQQKMKSNNSKPFGSNAYRISVCRRKVALLYLLSQLVIALLFWNFCDASLSGCGSEHSQMQKVNSHLCSFRSWQAVVGIKKRSIVLLQTQLLSPEDSIMWVAIFFFLIHCNYMYMFKTSGELSVLAHRLLLITAGYLKIANNCWREFIIFS